MFTAGDIKINAAAGAVEALKTYKGNTEEFNAYSYYINNQDLQTAIGADGDKPLILTGVRQCGKTYIVNEFARKNFESYVYVNFESDETLMAMVMVQV